MKYKPENADRYFQSLIEQVPEFAPIYDAHLSFNDELIPYPLMDEFARFLVEQCRKSLEHGLNRKKHRDVFTRGVGFLESSLKSNDSGIALMVRSTISETFSSLWQEELLFLSILRSIGPCLRSTLSMSGQTLGAGKVEEDR
jgi:hypothetical protein